MKRLILILAAPLFLAGCNNQIASVDLPPEERAGYEKTIAEYTQKLRDFDPRAEAPKDPQTVTQEGIEFEYIEKGDARPPFNYFLQIALAQEDLGRLGDALKTYKKAMSLYENSEVAWNNMGRIYEQLKKYDKAIRYYQLVIKQFGHNAYYLDVANAYIKKGDPDAAQKIYDEYRLLTNRTDVPIERAITDLRQSQQAQ